MNRGQVTRRARIQAIVAAVVLVSSVGLWGCGVREEPLPKLGAVPAFSMRDQDGRTISEQSLRGRPSAVTFMFTRCPSICPAVTRAMRGVQQEAVKKGVALRLVSITVDPENDSPAVLKEYAHKYGADLKTWTFLTGNPSDLQHIAEQGFKIAFGGSPDPSKSDFGITHGTHLVLVDRDLQIRGYYRSSDPEALAHLVTDAGRLAH